VTPFVTKYKAPPFPLHLVTEIIIFVFADRNNYFFIIIFFVFYFILFLFIFVDRNNYFCFYFLVAPSITYLTVFTAVSWSFEVPGGELFSLRTPTNVLSLEGTTVFTEMFEVLNN